MVLLRFSAFEIDEPRRELRAGGQVLPLQPRLFDLLVYLARHRDRVVPKDELLENLWPEVMVADGALQRAISLLRSTLGQAGAGDVIRTFPRHGYRFCADETGAESGSGESEPPAPLRNLATWASGKPESHTQAEFQAMEADALQQWAVRVQSSGKDESLILPLEQAALAHAAAGQKTRAAWAAMLLTQIRMEWRDGTVATGWYLRARRYLEGEEENAPRETGYLDYLGARFAVMKHDYEEALMLGQRAHRMGERIQDADLETLGLITAGEVHLLMGKVHEGMAALDEVGVAVSTGGLSSWAGGIIYCGLIYTCMARADWGRASEWTDQFFRWGEHRGAAAYPGLCRLHQAELMTVRGELAEAEKEIRATIAMLAFQAPWLEGEAWRSLGETLLAKGDTDAARGAFTRSMELGWDAQLDLALVLLAEDDAPAALKRLSRAMAEQAYSCRARMGRALPHLVVAASRAGELGTARSALQEMDRMPETFATSALQALVTNARAEEAAANGRTMEALSLFRSALRQWLEIGSPLQAAHVRCRLALLLEHDDDPELAALERRAAEAIFKQCGARAPEFGAGSGKK